MTVPPWLPWWTQGELYRLSGLFCDAILPFTCIWSIWLQHPEQREWFQHSAPVSQTCGEPAERKCHQSQPVAMISTFLVNGVKSTKGIDFNYIRMKNWSSTQLMRILEASKTVFMDGTFKSSPQHFKQLYTIHGLFKGHFVPLVNILFPSKPSDAYFNMFSIVKRHMADLDIVFNPESIMIDFEMAMIIVLNAHFLTSQVRGCLFSSNASLLA